MILKFLWISFMFLVIIGGIFVASFGIPLQEAIYEKTEVIVAADER